MCGGCALRCNMVLETKPSSYTCALQRVRMADSQHFSVPKTVIAPWFQRY